MSAGPKCFICGGDAQYWHGSNDNPGIRIKFCHHCMIKAEKRDDFLKQIRTIRNKDHLFVNGQQGCQIRIDKIIGKTDKIEEVTCRRCLLSLYHFGTNL